MTCPYLQYRRRDGDDEFDHERPYCEVAGSFVTPMKADVCNDRFDFHHTTHCEVFKEQEADARR